MLLPILLVLASAGDDARLANGEILMTTKKVAGSEIEEATARAVIDAPPEVVWNIVSDCANYKKTMPSIIESVKLSDEPPTAADGANAVVIRKCRVVADLPFPFEDLVSVTRGVHTIDPGKQWKRQWKLIEGSYNRVDGSWTVTPYGADGKRSLAVYRLHAEPKVALPQWLLASIQNGKLPEVMKNLREKVKGK